MFSLFFLWSLLVISENVIIWQGPDGYWEGSDEDNGPHDPNHVSRHVVSHLMDDDVNDGDEEIFEALEVQEKKKRTKTSAYKHEDDWVETNKPIQMVLSEFRNEFKVIAKETGMTFHGVGLKRSLRISWQISNSPECYFSLSLITDSGGVSDISLGKSTFELVYDKYKLLIETDIDNIYLAEIQPGFFVTVTESKTLNPEANLIGLTLLYRLGFLITNSSNDGNVTIGAIPEFFSKFKSSKYRIVQVNLLYHYYVVMKYSIVTIAIVILLVVVNVTVTEGKKIRVYASVYAVVMVVCTVCIVHGKSEFYVPAVYGFVVLTIIITLFVCWFLSLRKKKDRLSFPL